LLLFSQICSYFEDLQSSLAQLTPSYQSHFTKTALISSLSLSEQKLVDKYVKKTSSMLPFIEFKNGKFYLKSNDVTDFITTLFTLSGLNIFGIENRFHKVIIQVFDPHKFVFIYYEQEIVLSEGRNLFEQLETEIKISEQEIIKEKHYSFVDFLEFQIFFQNSYFLH
jgi:hypothetical protein